MTETYPVHSRRREASSSHVCAMVGYHCSYLGYGGVGHRWTTKRNIVVVRGVHDTTMLSDVVEQHP
jgi:hypothetical protein